MTTQSIQPHKLREALSSFATGVTIITASDQDGNPCGMTASSFNSVSMNPPLILWSIGKNALSAPVFTTTELFAVHILHKDQIETSNAFAKSGTDKFSNVDYVISDQGVPHLSGVLTRFDCKTWSISDGGDHWVIIGEVLNLEKSKGEGLVFANGSYATANPIIPHALNASEIQDLDAPIENLLIYHLSRAYKQLSEQFHEAVLASGLSVAEWRILASLQGQARREFSDLVNRTFVDPANLNDLLVALQKEGLCSFKACDEESIVWGTVKGNARVEHLFKLGSEQETSALGEAGKSGLSQLIAQLKEVVNNTNSTNS